MQPLFGSEGLLRQQKMFRTRQGGNLPAPQLQGPAPQTTIHSVDRSSGIGAVSPPAVAATAEHPTDKTSDGLDMSLCVKAIKTCEALIGETLGNLWQLGTSIGICLTMFCDCLCIFAICEHV